MTRLYARALGGGRAVDSTPLNTPQGTTILSSIRINGQTVYTTYPGGTTAEKFAEYLKDILIPTLDKDSVIVMDNMCIFRLNSTAVRDGRRAIPLLTA